MRSNKAPQNQQACPAARVKHTTHASNGTTSAAHSTSRAPLQPHLNSPHATPRHTLHNHLSPSPRPVRHVHIGRRSGQSLARGRHTVEHKAHWHQWRTVREVGAGGRQRFLPTVLPAWRSLRKQPRLDLDELEQALDLRAKFLGRLQLAVGDEGKRHESASEAIGK